MAIRLPLRDGGEGDRQRQFGWHIPSEQEALGLAHSQQREPTGKDMPEREREEGEGEDRRENAEPGEISGQIEAVSSKTFLLTVTLRAKGFPACQHLFTNPIQDFF